MGFFGPAAHRSPRTRRPRRGAWHRIRPGSRSRVETVGGVRRRLLPAVAAGPRAAAGRDVLDVLVHPAGVVPTSGRSPGPEEGVGWRPRRRRGRARAFRPHASASSWRPRSRHPWLPRGRSVSNRSAPGLAVTALVAAAVFLLAYDAAGYRLESRTTAAIVLVWSASLAVVLGLWPVVRPPRGRARDARPPRGVLRLARGSRCSGRRAPSAPSRVRPRRRSSSASSPSRSSRATRRTLRRSTDGLALAIAAVGVLALASRLFPDTFPNGNMPEFLPERLDAALAGRSSTGTGSRSSSRSLCRSCSGCATASREPARARRWPSASSRRSPATIYLTSSRGGFAAAVVGLVVFLVLTPRRWAAGLGLALGSRARAAVIAILVERSTLANEPSVRGGGRPGPLAPRCSSCSPASPAARLFALAVRYVPLVRVPRAVGIAVVVVLAVAAARGDRRRRSRPTGSSDFQATADGSIDEADFVKAHLLTGSGNGRWQFWGGGDRRVAREDPVVGRGAGSYEAWWAEHGSFTYFIEDAHSLYLETLGELGLIGLLCSSRRVRARPSSSGCRLRRAATSTGPSSPPCSASSPPTSSRRGSTGCGS